MRERYAADPKVTISDDYLHDLAAQVSANSIITKRKFNAFYFGAALATLAIGILAVTAMCMTYKFLWP